jgi:hypothetical protein
MTMELPKPATAISSDIVNSSRGGYRRHSALGIAAEDAFSAALEIPPPFPGDWVRSNRGDGELTLAPAEVPAAWVLVQFINQVRINIRDYNRNKSPDHQLRLRIGIDSGDVSVDGDGVPRGGDAIVVAARLRDTDAAKEAMAAVPEAPLVVVLSEGFYLRAVPHGELGLEERMFRRVRAQVPGKDFSETCYLYVPGHQPPYVTGAEHDPISEPSPSQPAPAAEASTSSSHANGQRHSDNGTDDHAETYGEMHIGSVKVYGQSVVGNGSQAINHGAMHFGRTDE